MTGIPYNSWRWEWAANVSKYSFGLEWAFVNYALDTVYREYIIERPGGPLRRNMYLSHIDQWHCTPGLAPKDVILTRIYDADV